MSDKKELYWDIFDALVENVNERAHCRQVAMPFDGDITLFPVALFHDLIEDGYIELSDLVELAKLEPSQKKLWTLSPEEKMNAISSIFEGLKRMSLQGRLRLQI